MSGYVGRFAPSPTGPLHAGSLVAALASFLDARAHQGTWLVRVEDVDRPRCPAGMAEHQLHQLQALGFIWDGPVWWQSQREDVYALRLQALIEQGRVYGCNCTRSEIERHWLTQGVLATRHQARPYPGTCRDKVASSAGTTPRAWRFKVPPGPACQVDWTDARQGRQHQDVAIEVGDFILKRADGLFAYQWAVVVDDQDQGVTHVVRGEDLADNTPRQILLQRALGAKTPSYLHTPLVLAADGQKLSKQNGAAPLDLAQPARLLSRAAHSLDLFEAAHRASTFANTEPSGHFASWVQPWLRHATIEWAHRWRAALRT